MALKCVSDIVIRCKFTSLHDVAQEAYIRGVSGWNFDVAALKRSANEEGGPGLERLSTIPETAGLTSAYCCSFVTS